MDLHSFTYISKLSKRPREGKSVQVASRGGPCPFPVSNSADKHTQPLGMKPRPRTTATPMGITKIVRASLKRLLKGTGHSPAYWPVQLALYSWLNFVRPSELIWVNAEKQKQNGMFQVYTKTEFIRKGGEGGNLVWLGCVLLSSGRVERLNLSVGRVVFLFVFSPDFGKSGREVKGGGGGERKETNEGCGEISNFNNSPILFIIWKWEELW